MASFRRARATERCQVKLLLPPTARSISWRREMTSVDLERWGDHVRSTLGQAGAWDLYTVVLKEEHVAPSVLRPVVAHLKWSLRVGGRPHPPVFLHLDVDQADTLEAVAFIWARLWHGEARRTPALCLRHDAGERRQTWVTSSAHPWMECVLPAVFENPILTSAILRPSGPEAPSHTWSYRMRALRELGLVRPLLMKPDWDVRSWHEKLTGQPLGRRPVAFYRSVLYDIAYPGGE